MSQAIQFGHELSRPWALAMAHPQVSDAPERDHQDIHHASMNIPEDFDGEKCNLKETQTATLNILDDLLTEKARFAQMQSATLNILEDINSDRLHFEEIQRALLNILEDLNESTAKLKEARDGLEIRVQERTAELARSNTELQQFAYVASHDLQEPLRMVASYVQLLQRRYQGKLDADADEFIGFAAEGALRMQRLLNDLLAYSRVGTRGEPFKDVSLESVLAEVRDNLQLLIRESCAEVTYNILPWVLADAGQLIQLFQNLIENAIKFRGKERPAIQITADVEDGRCLCRIKDNGIGIAPEYHDKIFEIFQRLHTRKEYPGTGIGLAVCKRIVNRHGGDIWVESQADAGTTFSFTLPVATRSHSNGEDPG